MGTINIANLPDAGVISDGDYLHLSKTGDDYKVTIIDLAEQFGLVDIYGLNEEPAVAGADFLPYIDTSVGLDFTANRKVSFDDVSALLQTATYYAQDDAIDLDDDFIYRKDDESTLKQVNMTAVRDLALKFNDLTSTSTVAVNDVFAMYNTVGGTNKFITRNNLQQSILDYTSLSQATTTETADKFFMNQDSSGQARYITYGNLLSELQLDLNVGGQFLSATANDTAAGTITFANGTTGLKTNTINSIGGAGITIKDDITVQNNVGAANITAISSVWGVGDVRFGSTPTVMTSVLLPQSVRTTYGSTATTIQNKITALVTTGVFAPAVDNGADLGSESLKWNRVNSELSYTNHLTVDNSAWLPASATYIGGTNLMSSGKINSNLLPQASDTVYGAMQSADSNETEFRTTDKTKAITTYSLATAIESKSTTGYSINSGTTPTVTATNVSTGIFRRKTVTIGGLRLIIIEVDFGTNPTISDITVNLNGSALAFIGGFASKSHYVGFGSAIQGTSGSGNGMVCWNKDASTTSVVKFRVERQGISGNIGGAVLVIYGLV